MKKDKKVIIILICTFLILASAYFIKNKVNGHGIYSTNIRMVEKGKYLYFASNDPNSDGSTKSTIFKVSKDGKEIKPLKTVDYAMGLSIYKDKLYFVQGQQVCRMSLDGSNYEVVADLCFNYCIARERIFYTNSSYDKINIYSKNLDLKDEKLLIKGVIYYRMYKDKIYTTTRLTDNSYTVNEWNVNGKLIRKVCSIENSIFEIESGKILYNPMNLTESGSDGIAMNQGSNIFSVDIKTGKKTKIVNDNVLGFVTAKGIIYYVTIKNDSVALQDNSINNYNFFSCNVKGGEKKRSSYEMFWPYSIDGKDMYYIDDKENLQKSKVNEDKGKILVPYEKLHNIK